MFMSWRNTKDWQFHVSAGLRPTISMTRLFLNIFETLQYYKQFKQVQQSTHKFDPQIS